MKAFAEPRQLLCIMIQETNEPLEDFLIRAEDHRKIYYLFAQKKKQEPQGQNHLEVTIYWALSCIDGTHEIFIYAQTEKIVPVEEAVTTLRLFSEAYFGSQHGC